MIGRLWASVPFWGWPAHHIPSREHFALSGDSPNIYPDSPPQALVWQGLIKASTRAPRESFLVVLFWSSCFRAKNPQGLALFKSGSLNMFCKTLVGSVKWISICVGFRSKKSVWFFLAFNMLCASTSYLLLNFHFHFLADYLYGAICEWRIYGFWQKLHLVIENCLLMIHHGSLSTSTYISNIVSPWQSKIRESFGISHHLFLHVSDLPGSRLWWEVVWWCQWRKLQSW